MVEGRFGPAVVVDGAFAVAVFLSEVEVVEEGVGRLVGAAGEPPLAAAELGRILAAVLGLVAPAAGCDAGTRHTGWMESKIRRGSKGNGKKKKIRTMDDNGTRVKQLKQQFNHK